MKLKHSNSNLDRWTINGKSGGVEVKDNSVQKIMIPIELDTRHQVTGYFSLVNICLPESGQKNLNEITGTPFRPEVAGLTVIAGPIAPDLQENYVKALIGLADSIDRCDNSAHSRSTALWAQRLAENLDFSQSEVQEIRLAGRLHDIGKAVVPRGILTKPGPLTAEEWATIKRHPEFGATLLEPSPSLRTLVQVVRSHHEWFNGTGYPDRLDAETIPTAARILSVADAFSTMTTDRAYRKPISVESALEELVRCSGTQFDPVLVELMVGLVRHYLN
jgi:HD-GYP domain-containing protein (c-di-GMP phosphodiesterase class II)